MSASLRVVIVLVLATAAVWAAARLIAGFCGVGDRWLEVGGTYTAERLAGWMESDPARAGRYAVPVLVPMDLVFLVLLGATLAVTSVALAGLVRGFGMLAWTVVLLPALYAGADLAEDGLLAGLLLRAVAITDNTVAAVRTMTLVKIWAVKLAVAQTVILALAALLWRR